MAGTLTTPRVAGIADSGFPAEIDASVKIRWVDDLLINMSERSADLLKYLGGTSGFMFNNTKVEWVEDDPWNRRPTLGATPLSNAGDTTLTLAAGTTHRYPVGTIFKNIDNSSLAGELVRVTGHPGDPDLTVVRDITAAGAEGAWATGDEVVVAGFSMDENDEWVARPTAIFNLPFNYAQVAHVAADVTYRRQETALYGLRGTDLDKVSADTTAEQFVAIEQEAAHGSRFAGTSTVPAMFGGLVHFITDANGAQVTDLSGAALTRKDIDDKLQDLYYEVGSEKMAMTILISAWGKRKITSFFSAAERLGPGASQAGVAIDRFRTEWGDIDVLMHTALSKGEMYFIRRELNKIGHHGSRGRPHLEEAVAIGSGGQTGPFVRRIFYSDLSMLCKGVQGEGRIHNFSQSA
ncbi:MAG: DUF5309 family protein [Chloroflexi bacterium]|nr:DUF5309 family protein [Chloroflexota bacterium]